MYSKLIAFVKLLLPRCTINQGQSTISTTRLSDELSTFLNCDLTLIYLLRRVRAKAQDEPGAGDLLEIGIKYGSSWRIYCLRCYTKYCKFS